MKKIIGAILLIGISATIPFAKYHAAKAETLDSADMAFLEFMGVEDKISYERYPLYNECLESSGWQYNFRLDGTYGFALIAEICEDNLQSFEVEEVYYEKTSPFANCEGTPIYITFNQYIEHKDGCYFDLSSGIELSQATIDKALEKGFGYSGSGNTTEIKETISYSSKTENLYTMKGDVPKYSSVEGATNCANVAGGVLVGYYDRFCENLIPNFQNYRVLGTSIIYKTLTAESSKVINSLKDLMGTDINQLGTTFTGFESGMSEYTRSHGYTYKSESLLTGGNFDFSKYKSSVENNKPVALFLNNYAFLDSIQENNGQDAVSSTHSTVAHVVVACGYKQYNYYNSNGQKTAERIYLKVCSGFAVRGICYLNINSVSKIDKAISVIIS